MIHAHTCEVIYHKKEILLCKQYMILKYCGLHFVEMILQSCFLERMCTLYINDKIHIMKLNLCVLVYIIDVCITL